MRSIIKFLTITTITATSILQVTACKDDSAFNTFMSDISNSISDNSAFFGFLGSADDVVSNTLQNSIDFFNKVDSNNTYSWQNWINKHNNEWNNSKLNLNNIHLHYYQGPSHQDKPSNIVDSFWSDKNISWQKNIFNWINSHTKNNDAFKTPKEGAEVNKLSTKKDSDDNDMFEALPIVFIISKGKLITAGQNWTTATGVSQQFDALTSFILDNLLSIN